MRKTFATASARTRKVITTESKKGNWMVKLLSDKRQAWAHSHQAQAFKGNALAYPVSVAAKYRDSLSSLVEPMVAEYERELTRLARPYTADESLATRLARMLGEFDRKWSRRFAERSRVLTDQMLGRVDRYASKALTASLKEMSGGLTLKTPHMPAALYDRLLAATKDNVALIESIQADFHARIEGAVMRSISSGNFGSKTLFEEIQKTGQVTKGRAEFIAVDQTRKVTTAMNAERMKAAGVRQFEWIHSGGGANPRKLHVDYDGQIFDMDNPPVIDERTKERGLPGQLINCRCRMRPVVNFKAYLDEQ